jgi:UDP-N-acetyl-D-glucosamine dehydrogenase
MLIDTLSYPGMTPPRPVIDVIEPETTTHDAFDVCILGLGYVGLPTALSLTQQCSKVLGIDLNMKRLRAVLAGDVDLIGEDRPRLDRALETSRLRLSAQPSLLRQAGAVIICVPTPIDSHQVPDLTMLRNACTLVATHARPGQTIILMSTTYVGTTRDLLVEPFRNRGMEAGRDIFIAFSPERIDPGNATHPQHTVPRVVGGTDPESAQRASTVLSAIAPSIHLVSSAEAAELTKLYENTFRAVNIAFALEMSQAATALDLSVLEVIDAAATKPYGFMPFYPSAGVGGHCIPCDPHYLLWQLRAQPAPHRRRAAPGAARRCGRARPGGPGAHRGRVLQARCAGHPGVPRDPTGPRLAGSGRRAFAVGSHRSDVGSARRPDSSEHRARHGRRLRRSRRAHRAPHPGLRLAGHRPDRPRRDLPAGRPARPCGRLTGRTAA